MMQRDATRSLDLAGLSIGSPQLWRAIRIVPLMRDSPMHDLRLDLRCHEDEASSVRLDDHTSYTAFIPHAFVARWGEDGRPLGALGTQSSTASARPVKREKRRRLFNLRYSHRMAKRERHRDGSAARSLRFLPLHTAFEGYLALHFSGPDVLYRDYTDDVISKGLSPRIEFTTPGEWIPGLEEALRVFEVREGQVGSLVFVADALAGAFVVPHPDDYRQLHRSLLGDFYGELIYRFGCLYDDVGPMVSPIDAQRVHNIDDLSRELTRIRGNWSMFLQEMASGLFTQPVRINPVYKMGRHQLSRFLPVFRPGCENHIGELIRTPQGELSYLKTFRLSDAQVRRGHLLSTLSSKEWNLDEAATALNGTRAQLIARLESAGFGDLLREHVRLEASR